MRNPKDEDLDVWEGTETSMEPGQEGNVDVDIGFDLLDEPVEDGAATSDNGRGSTQSEPLLSPQEVTSYRARWEAVQGAFIDDPRRAVEQADNLVDRVVQRLTDGFAEERDHLVRKWDHGPEPVSTEDLRQALQGYRAFLDRLFLL